MSTYKSKYQLIEYNLPKNEFQDEKMFYTFVLDEIIKLVTKYTGFTKEQLSAKDRRVPTVQARNLYFKVAKNNGFSWELIARFVNKDHSTALHGVETFENDMFLYPNLKSLYEKVNSEYIMMVRASRGQTA